jgi:hypothetical protein
MPHSDSSLSLSPPLPTEEFNRQEQELEQVAVEQSLQPPHSESYNSSAVSKEQKRPTTSSVWTDKDTGIVNGHKVTVNGRVIWACAHCKNRTAPQKYRISSGTSPCSTHLSEKHGMVEASSRKRQRLELNQIYLQAATQQAVILDKARNDAGKRQPTHDQNTTLDPDIQKQLLLC